MRLLMDWVAAFKFLIEGSGASGIAVVKAHINFLLCIDMEIKKRNLLKDQIPNFEVKNSYKGLITVDFYLKNRRKFDELRFKVNNPK